MLIVRQTQMGLGYVWMCGFTGYVHMSYRSLAPWDAPDGIRSGVWVLLPENGVTEHLHPEQQDTDQSWGRELAQRHLQVASRDHKVLPHENGELLQGMGPSHCGRRHDINQFVRKQTW